MTRRKKRRLLLIGAAAVVVGIAATLIFQALSSQMVFFRTPAEIASVTPGQRVRIGGLVKPGSLVKTGPTSVRFDVTDTKNSVVVTYTGLLPDLFREGQGVVAEGTVSPGGQIVADTILAKHDERYMPKEVADALKAQGVWREGSPQQTSQLQ